MQSTLLPPSLHPTTHPLGTEATVSSGCKLHRMGSGGQTEACTHIAHLQPANRVQPERSASAWRTIVGSTLAGCLQLSSPRPSKEVSAAGRAWVVPESCWQQREAAPLPTL